MDARWPTFGPLAQSVGVLSALSVCIHLDRDPATVLGSLNQYSSQSDAFDRADEEMAIILAAHAAVAIDALKNASQLLNQRLTEIEMDVTPPGELPGELE